MMTPIFSIGLFHFFIIIQQRSDNWWLFSTLLDLHRLVEWVSWEMFLLNWEIWSNQDFVNCVVLLNCCIAATSLYFSWFSVQYFAHRSALVSTILFCLSSTNWTGNMPLKFHWKLPYQKEIPRQNLTKYEKSVLVWHSIWTTCALRKMTNQESKQHPVLKRERNWHK